MPQLSRFYTNTRLPSLILCLAFWWGCSRYEDLSSKISDSNNRGASASDKIQTQQIQAMATAANSRRLTVMTYNIGACCGNPENGNRWYYDVNNPTVMLEALERLIVEHHVDVVALQEVRNYKDKDLNPKKLEFQRELANRLKNNHGISMNTVFHQTFNLKNGSHEGQFGMALLSRFPFKSKDSLRLNADRIVQSVVIDGPGGAAVTIVNVHPHYDGGIGMAQHLKIYNEYLPKVAASADQVIIAGDFNAEEFGPRYNIYVHGTDVNKTKHVDTCSLVDEDQLCRNTLSRGSGRVDYIFFKEAAGIKVNKVVTDQSVNFSPDGNPRQLSDHLPLIAELILSSSEPEIVEEPKAPVVVDEDPASAPPSPELAFTSNVSVVRKDAVWIWSPAQNAWTFSGYLRDIPAWTSAPQVGGQRPYQGAGLTAAWGGGGDADKTTVINQDKFWIWSMQQKQWVASGFLRDLLEWRNAPTVGGMKPYDGEGLTAAWGGGNADKTTVINRDKFWIWSTSANGWVASGFLKDLEAWRNAPAVDGLRPYEGQGVTAAWGGGNFDKTTVVSQDRYWVWSASAGSWVASGRLSDHPHWQQAPSVGGRPYEGGGLTAGWGG